MSGHARDFRYDQIQKPRGKLVRGVVVEVFDVAVDTRRNSPTFANRWAASSVQKTIFKTLSL